MYIHTRARARIIMLRRGGKNVCCVQTIYNTAGNRRLKAILTLTEKTGPGYELWSLYVQQLGGSHVYPGPKQYACQYQSGLRVNTYIHTYAYTYIL